MRKKMHTALKFALHLCSPEKYDNVAELLKISVVKHNQIVKNPASFVLDAFTSIDSLI